MALREVSESHPDDSFPVSVHYNDVMAVQDYSSRLLEMIGKAGTPYAYTMRMAKHSGSVGSLAIQVDYLTLTETYAMVEIASELKDDIVRVSGTLVSDKDLAAGKWGLELILTEDDVYHPGSAAYNQSNAYADSGQLMGGFENLPNPVSSEDMHYMDVARIAFPVPEADLPLNVPAGEDVTFTTRFELPHTVDNAGNCKVTALLLDDKGAVINSCRCSLATDSSALDMIGQDISDEHLAATVWTFDGRLIDSGVDDGGVSIPTLPGVYLVRRANRTTKVVVR